jgi:hypothetical protein
MRTVGLIALTWCAASSLYGSQVITTPEAVYTYELYSWEGDRGVWNFGLFPAISNSGLAPKLITSRKTLLVGLDKLKGKIATLPASSEILWLDHTMGVYAKAKGSEIFKYPPPNIVADIQRHCETKRIKLLKQ